MPTTTAPSVLTRGGDFARFQEVVDWALLPADREFAYLGMWDWQNLVVDKQLARNVLEGSVAGRTLGGYMRVNPTRWTPAQEARRMLALAAAHNLLAPGRLIPAVDIEPTGDKEADKLVNWPQWTASFFDSWRTLSGLPLVVYSSGSYFSTLLGGTGGWPLWVKCWVGHSEKYSRPAGLKAEDWAGKTWYEPQRCVVHQYTTTGRLAGISKPVDLDCLMPGVQLSDITLHAA